MVNGAKTKEFINGGIAEVEGSSPELVQSLRKALPEEASIGSLITPAIGTGTPSP